MSRRARRIWIAAGFLAGLVATAALTGILVLRSGWFRNEVRARIVAEVEKATGGRAEIGTFRFDWKRMRAQVDGFVLHGSEPRDAPPLFRANRIAVDIKIVSLLKRSVDIRSLDVERPQVCLILYPDGHTNLPAPKVKRTGKPVVETFLDLAIGRFRLLNGSFEVQGRGETPFDAQGRDLRAQFNFDTAAPSYRGQVSIAPADIRWGGHQSGPMNIDLALAVEKNRLEIAAGHVSAGKSQVQFSGTIDDLAEFAGAVQYKARISLGEVARTLDWHTQLEGPVTLAGTARFRGLADYSARGSLHVSGLRFHPDPHFTLTELNADGAVTIEPRRITLSGMRLSGMAVAALTGTGRQPEPVPLSGRVESLVLRGKMLEAGGIHIDMLNGSFEGRAGIADFERIQVEGRVDGFDVQKMLRVYNGQSVPWDAAASGPMQLSASLRDARALRLAGKMSISPAGTGAPVRGSVDARYDGSQETLDLGRSYLALPSTRLEFSGVLGRQLRVHFDSRDLDDILPAFDMQSLPVKLENGEAQFRGLVAGKLDDPHISGHGKATGLVWAGRECNALSGDIGLTPAGLTVRNGSAQLGEVRAQGGGSLGMRDWKVESASPVSASGKLHGPAPDLLRLAQIQLPIQGNVNANAGISGTFGDPHIEATVSAASGAIEGEPFDRFQGAVDYSGTAVTLANAQISAGARAVTFQAHYQYQPGNFELGELRFQVDTNSMPLEEFRILSQEYPSIGGMAEVHATGAVNIVPQKSGPPTFRLAGLNGTLDGRGLRISDQPLQDILLTATTKGSVLAAHFVSELAGSRIVGDGTCSLTDDYPASAKVTFTRLDMERLRAWLKGAKPPAGVELAGFAEGSLSISGPALQPEQWKAALRIPSLRVGPGGKLAADAKVFALHNPAPIVVNMHGEVIQVESARLVGRATDLSLSGTVDLKRKNPLDLRVNGKFDLATLEDFDADLHGAGVLETGATIRGPIAQPQINGRLEIKDADFSLAEAPVGVSKATGVILFDGSRATIQNFSANSGGGKLTLSGFAGYGGNALVFRLHANAHEMRVRYPADFSTVANASLSLTGTSESSMLAGEITVLRTGFNPRSDFSSILAESAEPVRTPSAQTGLVANMHFDVQIVSAPGITFQSSLASGIQAEANLHLRGTGANPSLLGRINITQGQVVFFGTTFTVNQGSIAFYNPVKIEPVLNIDLNTKARGIDVILNIAGPINKLNLTPRSDPPMPFSDIVALLATGRAPTTDYATLMASPAAPQSLQPMGATALLGEAIASPVTGRLQRFFGVTRLKIDPTLTSLTGVENNPQARLTIEQQVTPDITFTYITDVTSSNPLVVQVEWAFSRHWSAVALRDENGLVGLNFVYKKRFR